MSDPASWGAVADDGGGVNYVPTIDVGGPEYSSSIPAGQQGSEYAPVSVSPDLIRKRLKAKGYPDAAIDGIIANFQRESKDNPSAVGDHGTSFGLGQWHLSRKDDLFAFAKKEGKSPSDPDVQIDFMDQELRTKYPKLFASLMNETDSGDAEEKFKRIYERPASIMWAAGPTGSPALGGSGGYYQFAPEAYAAANQPDTSLIFMPPQDYLDLSPPLPEGGNARQRASLEKSLAAGEPIYELPSLDVSMEGPSGTVTDQDGRHRALLAQENGLDMIPVAVKGAPAGQPVTELQGMTGNVRPVAQAAPFAAPRRSPGMMDWLIPSASAAEALPQSAAGNPVARAQNVATSQEGPQAWGAVPLQQATAQAWGAAPAEQPVPHTSIPGIVAAIERGLAPYAAGAAIGAGLGSVFGGVGAIPGAAAGIGAVALSDLASAAWRPIAGMTGAPQIPSFSGATNRLLDVTGLPRPQTPAERIAEATASGIGGAGGLAGAGMLTEGALNPVVQTTGKEIARQMVPQLAAGGISGAAAQSAAEMGYGPVGQFLAGMLGAGVGAIGVATTAPLVRWVAGERGAVALQNKAVQAVALRIARDAKAGGPTAQDMLDLAAAAPEKPLTIADVGGENTLALAGRMARAPGPSRQTMTNALNQRDLGAGERLAGDVNRGIAAGSAYDAAAALSKARATAAAPKYDAAFAEKVTLPQVRPLQSFVTDKIGQEALQHGMRVIQLEDLAQGKLFRPSKFGVVKNEKTGKWVIDPSIERGEKAPSLRLLDAVKRGYDEIVEGFRDPTTGRLNLNQYGRAVNQVRAAYVGALRAAFPKYAAALDAWSGPSQSLDALRAGQGFMRQRPEEIARRIASLTPNDREFYKLGAADTLRAALAKKGAQADETKALIGNQYVRDQLRPLFDSDDAYRRFIAGVEAEARMFGTRYHVLGGSQTAARVVEDQSPDFGHYAHLARGVAHAAHGNVPWALYDTMRGVMPFMRRGGNPALNEAIAGILTSPLNDVHGTGINLLRNFALVAPRTRNYLGLGSPGLAALSQGLAAPVPVLQNQQP